MKGRKIAHGYKQEQLDFLKDLFSEVTTTWDSLVADDHIVTAKPDAHIEFAIELACRLGVEDSSKANRLKEYYRGTLGKKIRTLALALLKNPEGQMLLHKAHDSVAGIEFYRPLGGGIEFSESGRETIAREVQEEIGRAAQATKLLTTLESRFVYEGKPGHEIVLVFEAHFSDPKSYDFQELEIMESGRSIGRAVWRSLQEIRSEGAKLFPTGLEDVLN